MSKRMRQYLGILAAVICYYVIHEGAHAIVALYMHAFKSLQLLGMGMQVDIYRERITNAQLGIFCLAGPAATLLAGIIMAALAPKIGKLRSAAVRACCYYVTLSLLLLDPVYMGLLCGFFGGGDMNGIALLLPQHTARLLFLVLLVVNLFLFFRVVLPVYTESFRNHT